MSKMPRCVVCGSSAPIMRASAERKRTLELCYFHEAVCWDHLADPCPTCDGESPEELAARDASLGVGHIWTATQCPAYATYVPADCTCG